MGKLVLVPTPVGNLEDITLRALRVLKEADVVYAEDTRVTVRLLQHFDIEARLKPFHKDNEHRTVGRVVDEIAANTLTALVSDAGTPGISDPGFLLVRECLRAGVAVECLPGASALLPALVVSGFPTDRFVFEGFLPHKKGRQTRISQWLDEERTIVLYESPHRLLKCLEQCAAILGPDRAVSISREISKKFEETIRGSLADAIAHFTAHEPRGEFVVVIAGRV
jgi:16S rRNA (cytidine1402-2'-O)-methyltransferase